MKTKPGSILGLVLFVALIAFTVISCAIHYAGKADTAVYEFLQRAQDPTARLYDIPYALPVIGRR